MAHATLQPHAVGAMGCAVVPNQGLAGFMVQVLQAARLDLQPGMQRSCSQAATGFLDDTEHDLAQEAWPVDLLSLG